MQSVEAALIDPVVVCVVANLTGNCEMGFSLLALLAALGSLSFMLANQPVLPRSTA